MLSHLRMYNFPVHFWKIWRYDFADVRDGSNGSKSKQQTVRAYLSRTETAALR